MLSNKKGFALVTVLMVLVLLLALSTGIIISSYIGIQRSSVFQDSNISYINAMSGSNMILAFFDALPAPPDWEADGGGDLGCVLSELPTELRNGQNIGAQNSPQGQFRVLRAERIGGGPSTIPQDFEVIVAGYTHDRGNLSNETFLRVRLRLGSDDSEFDYAYFTYSFNSQSDWVGSYGDFFNNVPAVRFVGRVHSNERINIRDTGRGGYEHGLDPRSPMFLDWRWRAANNDGHVLSVAAGERHAIRFLGGNIDDWDEDELYEKYEWGDSLNTNKPWFGLVGYQLFDEDSFGDPLLEEVTYGGYNSIKFDADNIPFPEVDPNLRSLVWNGTEDGVVAPAPDLDSPDRVRVPDSSRPNGGIYVYGDASVKFESRGIVPGTENIYNSRVIIEQPYEAENELHRWEIDISRNTDGLITNISRDFYIFNDEQGIFEIQGDYNVNHTYSDPVENMDIYVDGNIGWMEYEHRQGNRVTTRR